ncbi:hypothetical protein [Pseudoclavibacter helvolus]|uniref:Uncharacterized protein n=1 Tax=Pseudoclavibacter helvolus TaxID=255205 RepID=A0A7W4YFA5_9MICO|nr:hypothetical protein [Pseudoclavibacter helvolus]MBB2956821.1 hypothetical protein [Pseudoclavibacter helvolus]
MSLSKQNSRGVAVLAVLGNIAGGALALAVLIPLVWVLDAVRRDAPAGPLVGGQVRLSPPPGFCSEHPSGTAVPCLPCYAAAVSRAAWIEAHEEVSS